MPGVIREKRIMNTLLEIRDRIISLYRQYTSIFTIAFRFLAMLLALVYVNGRIGYQETLSGPMLTILLSLACALVPSGVAAAILIAVILVQLYSLATEAVIVGGILFLLMFLLYFRFQPGDLILFVLSPACVLLHIPYVLPVAGGLLYHAASGVTAALGMITVYFINFVSENAAAITSTSDDSDLISRFRFLMDGILQNKAMVITAVAMVACGILVYAVRRMMIRYAWYIAVAAGAILQIIIMTLGEMIYGAGISIGGVFGGCLVAVLVGVVITFFVFNLDYSRIENTQFEDDEYYYYVRAVPKNLFIEPRRSVKQINTSRHAPAAEAEPYYDPEEPEQKQDEAYESDRNGGLVQ